MTITSSSKRTLQVLAVVLGIANVVLVVLVVLCTRMEPSAPPPPVDHSPSATNVAPIKPESAVIEASISAQKTSTPDSSQATPPNELAQTSAVLYGTMRAGSGELIDNGYCWLYRDGMQLEGASLRQGTFVFCGLQVGEYRLRTRIEDQLPLERSIVVDQPRTRMDITLEACWLLAVNAVTPTGEPLLPSVAKDLGSFGRRGLGAAAFLEPRTTDLPASNYGDLSVGAGNFRGQSFPPRGKALPKQTVGMLALPAGQPLQVALMMRNAIVAQQQVSSGQEEVTFVLSAADLLAKTASVTLRLVDESGMPVADTSVALNDAQTGGGGRQTDEHGRVTLANLMPGNLDLEIGHGALRGPPVQIEVRAGAQIDLGDITLRPFVPIAFDLSTLGEGKGSVRYGMLDPPRDWTADEFYVSSENGSSTTHHVYPGRYGMIASGFNGVAVLEVDAHVAPAAPIRFDPQPGAQLRIDCNVGGGWVRLELRTPSGTIIRRRELTAVSQESVQLPLGAYVAIITDEAGITTRRAIMLGPAGAVLAIP